MSSSTQSCSRTTRPCTVLPCLHASPVQVCVGRQTQRWTPERVTVSAPLDEHASVAALLAREVDANAGATAAALRTTPSARATAAVTTARMRNQHTQRGRGRDRARVAIDACKCVDVLHADPPAGAHAYAL